MAEPQRGSLEPPQRTRLSRRRLQPRVHRWLLRVTKVHARLRQLVLAFNDPTVAGGQGGFGDAYADRFRRGDQTLISDACQSCRDELDAIMADVESAMADTPATTATPGSPEKVRVLTRRVHSGRALFIDGDRR